MHTHTDWFHNFLDKGKLLVILYGLDVGEVKIDKSLYDHEKRNVWTYHRGTQKS